MQTDLWDVLVIVGLVALLAAVYLGVGLVALLAAAGAVAVAAGLLGAWRAGRGVGR